MHRSIRHEDVSIPDPDELVLVAILNTPRDLEIAQTLGWYRIPLATAPKTVRVDWLAFYLPGSFEEDRWQVRYMAKVRGYELLMRKELLFQEEDHPRADEPYFKLQVGPLLELNPPIPSRGWHRFSFVFTTADRLFAASDLSELAIPASQIKSRLLRERAGSIPTTEAPL